VKRMSRMVLILVVLFGAAQFVRLRQPNPPIDARRTLQAQAGSAGAMAGILDRSCGDCHSNQTVWPWYTHVAPVSWLMSYAVAEGRKAVNFSDWAGYSPERQQQLLVLVCQDVTSGKMPSSAWTMLHPEARLSPQDVETICAATRQASAGR
jgi:hypothetical protein